MSPRERARLARPLGHSLSSRAIRGLSPGEPEREPGARVVFVPPVSRDRSATLFLLVCLYRDLGDEVRRSCFKHTRSSLYSHSPIVAARSRLALTLDRRCDAETSRNVFAGAS